MKYEFEDTVTGERVEVDMPMADAPTIGSIIIHNGRHLMRIPSLPPVRVAESLHFESHQLPKHWKHAKQHSPDGVCRFESHREIREALASARDAGEPISYGETDGYGSASRRRLKHGEV